MTSPSESLTQVVTEPTDAELLYWRYELGVRVEETQSRLDWVEGLLLQRMEKRGAISIPSEEYVCEMESKPTYHQPAFAPLKEIFVASDLRECWIPEREHTVIQPEKWDTTRVKRLAKRYGDEALAIVERARVPGRPRLKFGRREG